MLNKQFIFEKNVGTLIFANSNWYDTYNSQQKSHLFFSP